MAGARATRRGGDIVNESTDPLEPEPQDETRLYSAVEVCRVCALSEERLVEYVAHGVVVGAVTTEREREEAAARRFSHAELHRLVRAVRLRRELEVELPNLALVVDLMDTLERQRRELRRLRRELGARRER